MRYSFVGWANSSFVNPTNTFYECWVTKKTAAQPTFYNGSKEIVLILFYSEITAICFNDLADSAISVRLSSLNGIRPFSVK